MKLSVTDDITIVMTTVPDEATGEKLARALVEAELAACVNIVPGVRSIYRWQGKLCDDRELICLIKSRPAALPALAARLRELHPYEVPELLVLPPTMGSAAYVDWIKANVPT